MSSESKLTFVELHRAYTRAGIQFDVSQFQAVHPYSREQFVLSDQNVYGVTVLFEEDDLVQVRQRFVGAVTAQFDQVSRSLDSLFLQHGLAFPRQAVQEALSNAFIHRDYDEGSEDIIIRLSQVRLVIVNPTQTANQLTFEVIDGIFAHGCHPMLASVFESLGLANNFGVGLQRIILAYEGASVQPTFKSDEEKLIISLPNPNTEKETSLMRSLKQLEKFAEGDDSAVKIDTVEVSHESGR
jgi:predicted HTH transcriptional regulator